MTIDIISFTETQYAKLTAEQMLEVEEAQLKKNRLKKKADEAVQKEKERLIGNGIFHSAIFDLIKSKLQTEYEQEVEMIRKELLFKLRESDLSGGSGETDAPYLVDYTLSVTERFYIVKMYYETTYTDGAARFNAFKADQVAAEYLEELYAPLYDFFMAAS